MYSLKKSADSEILHKTLHIPKRYKCASIRRRMYVLLLKIEREREREREKYINIYK